MNYNTLAKEVYEANKVVGWWDEPNRCKLTLLQLVSTEIAEATEAERKDLMDDHLPHRKGGEVELADAMIRLLDMAGAYGWTYDSKYREIANDSDKIDSIAGKHAVLMVPLSGMVLNVLMDCYDDHEECYSELMTAIEQVANSQGYDLEGALREKLAYNAQRQDHKRSERAKAHGKAF